MFQYLSRRHFILPLVSATFLTLPFIVVQAEEEEEEVAPVADVQRAQVMWTDDTIDQWIFGNGRTALQAKKRLESQLSLRIEELDRACALTETQKQKLRLAGLGDVKRLFDDTTVIKKKFDKLRNDQNAINQIFQEIQPLQTRISAGIFQTQSFYQKSVAKTLTAEQAAKLEQLDVDRRKFRYHAKILLALTVMDAGVPLRDEQRQKLIKVLQEETKPPKRFGQVDYFVVLYQMARLPQEKIRPIFDDAQWKALQAQFEQAKGMEQHLKQSGILDEGPTPRTREKPTTPP